ncbi:hypothetical protein MBM_05741 [Drepanopeziza brunnea f. sp. 'multigermtubi' MB_m1]|uniref:Uncharacterized protein n=1 Tax=Marssonina brunnea f. sp. multigermtubi (strain MB_m1) TaxID=1072389 RepID=K1WVE7_MARBU|nr:uncharacterized protein MBM_05741 [Drepanopeziza brunnea f. sp. 'multigermtubi' MB_m1]EKD16447.1 hypothetical protein MBM_05741 [Drepanopeziza brunnea f. sp. 'multigermtubi' MB_m1]
MERDASADVGGQSASRRLHIAHCTLHIAAGHGGHGGHGISKGDVGRPAQPSPGQPRPGTDQEYCVTTWTPQDLGTPVVGRPNETPTHPRVHRHSQPGRRGTRGPEAGWREAGGGRREAGEREAREVPGSRHLISEAEDRHDCIVHGCAVSGCEVSTRNKVYPDKTSGYCSTGLLSTPLPLCAVLVPYLATVLSPPGPAECKYNDHLALRRTREKHHILHPGSVMDHFPSLNIFQWT